MRLFRHPVGIFPQGARWYLAMIAMLALLCVGMHLSIQIRAQQLAEKTIIQWGEEHNVAIGAVNYHLLRNALILQRVKLEKGPDEMRIDQLLVRANPEILTGSAPRIASVQVVGAHVRLSDPMADNPWTGDQSLQRLWQASREITLRDGTVSLAAKDDSGAALVIDDIRLHRETGVGDSLLAFGNIDGAPVELSWRQQGADRGLVSLSWQAVPADRITPALGLTAVQGQFSGQASWQNRSGQFELNGEVSLSGDESPAASLSWNGFRTEAATQLQIQAHQWPLRPWREQLPLMGERLLAGGMLNGKLRWRETARASRLKSERLDVRQLRYEATHSNDENSDADAWQRLLLENVEVDLHQRALHVASAQLQSGRMFIRPAAESGEAVAEHGAATQSPWRIRIDDAKVQNLSLICTLPSGLIRIDHLDGRLGYPDAGRMRFQLATSDNESGSAHWSAKGTIDAPAHRYGRAEVRLRGEKVQVAGLRPLLPLFGSEASALTLEGEADFRADAVIDRKGWRMKGEAQARELTLIHADDSWTAERVDIDFGPVGNALTQQRINSVRADGWHYITALKPLPSYHPDENGQYITAPAEPFWWASNLRDGGWHVGKVHWQKGSISVGSADARWGRKLDLKLDRIEPEQASRLTVSGEVGGGDFRFAGDWQAMRASAPFTGQIKLDHALPFFLNDWLNASGMPRLIRGRISASVDVAPGESAGDYRSQARVKLLYPLIEPAPAERDPMPVRVGATSAELLARLADEQGQIALQWQQDGNWDRLPLQAALLGQGLQQQLREQLSQRLKGQAADEVGRAAALPSGDETGEPREETRVRLHHRSSLSLNERIRINKALKKLKLERTRIIELVPVWPGSRLDQETGERIRSTQRLLSRYLVAKGIAIERIYPIIPSSQKESGALGAIIIRSRSTKSSENAH